MVPSVSALGPLDQSPQTFPSSPVDPAESFSLSAPFLEALLGRPAAGFASSSVALEFAGRSVLVTGAAGSIGADLCSNLLALSPSRLTCVDSNDTGLARLQSTIGSAGSSASRACSFHVADILDRQQITKLFHEHRPDIIFHAAAHKHLPLAEAHVQATVTNNVFGTLNVLLAAEAVGTRKLIFVSSDKAVDPISVLGVTKRIGELMLAAWPSRSLTCISARFGNVIGSAGSVIPIWQEQLARGGPLTVTDAAAERFFLLPSDAIALLLQAASIGGHRDIFVFAMGEPIRILDLAHNFLLHQASPRRSDIVFTGLRPGEKLKEALFFSHEHPRDTACDKIRRTAALACWSELSPHLDSLSASLIREDIPAIKRILRRIVPQYTPSVQ